MAYYIANNRGNVGLVVTLICMYALTFNMHHLFVCVCVYVFVFTHEHAFASVCVCK